MTVGTEQGRRHLHQLMPPKPTLIGRLLTGDAIKMDIPPMATPIPLANYHTVVIPPLLKQIIR